MEENKTEERAAGSSERGSAAQYSSEFKDKMRNVSSALSGLEGSSVYSGSEPKKSSFDMSLLDEANEQNQADKNKSALENPFGEGGSEAKSEEKKGQQEQGGEPEGKDQGAKTEEEAKGGDKGEESSLTFENPITGKVDLNKEKKEAEEGSEKPVEISEEALKGLEDVLTKSNVGITKDEFREKLPEILETYKSSKELSSKVEAYNNIFEKLPEDLYGSIVAWSNGEDYKSVIAQSNKMDYSKAFEDHGGENVAKAYFSEKISDEDWEEYKDPDGDEDVKERVQQYIDLSKDRYEVDRSKFENQKQKYETQAAEFNKNLQASFEKSREFFPKTFEEGTSLPVHDSYLNEVDNIAKNQQEVLSLFYNKDGTLREDAHLRIAMAKDGKQFVFQQAEMLKNKLVSQARQEVIKDMPDRAAVRKTGQDKTGSDPTSKEEKIKGEVNRILGNPDQRTY